MNLISNAAEAMKAGGLLTVTTCNEYLDRPVHGYDTVREGDYVVLTVSDTGEGISASDMKRIFEPFYTKKVMGRSGTGLGLAVVWGTVKDHNGYINVESEEGKGTTFTLYFPVTREDISREQNTDIRFRVPGKWGNHPDRGRCGGTTGTGRPNAEKTELQGGDGFQRRRGS